MIENSISLYCNSYFQAHGHAAMAEWLIRGMLSLCN